MKLVQNVGLLDRVTRVVVGSLLAVTMYFSHVRGLFGGLLFWIGIMTVLEGIMGYCFLYGLLGWSTKRRRRRAA